MPETEVVERITEIAERVASSEGMEIVDALYSGYGEGAPHGNGPDQGRIQAEGNAYLEKSFSKLDHIKSAVIEAPAR